MMMSTSPAFVFPSVAAGQQDGRAEYRQRVSSASSTSSSSSNPPSLTPSKSSAKRFSLADFPMPPPLHRPHSEPTPGYWAKLLASSSYAIRRRDTVFGEGRTSNGGIERGDFWVSDDDEDDDEEGEQEEDGFLMVNPQRQRAETMNPKWEGSSVPSFAVESVPTSAPADPAPSAGFRNASGTRPRSEGLHPSSTTNDNEPIVFLRFSSLSTTSSRGHTKSRKNMQKGKKPSTESSRSSGAASTIRGSTRTVRRAPSITSTIRMPPPVPTSIRDSPSPMAVDMSTPVLPIPVPPIPAEPKDSLAPVVPPRRSSLPKKSSRRTLRSIKSTESSVRSH